MRSDAAPCPCGSGQALSVCCGQYIEGKRPAPTALALMRSRYSAYVLQDDAYLRATWHPATCPSELNLNQEPQPKWLGLEIKQHTLQDATHATVEFVARCKIGGRAQRLHEVSRFECIADRWCYVDGEFPVRQ